MNYYAIAGGAFAVAVGSVGYVAYDTQSASVEAPISATVKMEVYDTKGTMLGHGSGVHLGNGYYLTAAHVADGSAVIKVRDESGYLNPAPATYIYISDMKNGGYDFAILRVANGDHPIAQADLTDRVPLRGETVQAQGYPGDYGRLTINGEVMGDVRRKTPWPQLLPLHITGSFGISGGPIFDQYGKVAGIFVSGEAPWGGTGLVVPVKVIYDLLGEGFVNGIDIKE